MGEAENTNAVEKTEEEIASAVPKPIELGPNDILEFGEPQPMPIVVDFSASWCGPCRQMHPIFDKLAKKYHGKVQFIYVDIDKAPQLAKQYGVEAVPTLLFVNKKVRLTVISVLCRKMPWRRLFKASCQQIQLRASSLVK